MEHDSRTRLAETCGTRVEMTMTMITRSVNSLYTKRSSQGPECLGRGPSLVGERNSLNAQKN